MFVLFLSVVVRSVCGMSAVQAEPPSTDALVVRLDEMLAELADAVAGHSPASDAARIDRIARLEKLRAVTAALQAAESVRFAQSQVAEQLAADVHPEAIGRGIAEQIGLACHISPVTAARRLNTARALWFELPDTYAQLTAGMLSERVAETVVTETRHLDAEVRRQVDTQLIAAGIDQMGFKAATACVRKLAYEADREGYVRRGRTERNTAASVCGPHPTPWQCSPATSQQNKASPATQPYADTPTGSSPPGTAEPGTRSWPTPSSNDSPDKPQPATSTLSCRLMMPLEALLDPHSNKPPHHPRLRTATPRPGPKHPDHQQRTEMVAPPLHRTLRLN